MDCHLHPNSSTSLAMASGCEQLGYIDRTNEFLRCIAGTGPKVGVFFTNGLDTEKVTAVASEKVATASQTDSS